jgi:hypothetical protein
LAFPASPEPALTLRIAVSGTMHALSVLLPLAALTADVLAAPTYPNLNTNAAMPGSIDTVSEYFNMLAAKVEQSRLMTEAPVCDLSQAVLPLSMSNPSSKACQVRL